MTSSLGFKEGQPWWDGSAGKAGLATQASPQNPQKVEGETHDLLVVLWPHMCTLLNPNIMHICMVIINMDLKIKVKNYAKLDQTGRCTRTL